MLNAGRFPPVQGFKARKLVSGNSPPEPQDRLFDYQQLAHLEVSGVQSANFGWENSHLDPLPSSDCMDRVHGGQVCGDMVDTFQRKLAGCGYYALACE